MQGTSGKEVTKDQGLTLTPSLRTQLSPTGTLLGWYFFHFEKRRLAGVEFNTIC
jgi:hypothetical protein